MCGIAGIVSDLSPAEMRESLQVMAGFMTQRGPDHCDLWLQEGVGFAHTRLSIIDLNERSSQPFLVPDRLALTFNGEIYNFKDLRKELEDEGHRFVTTSDTEVLAKAYLQWGIEMISRLDGMFAFGLLDLLKRKLYLARDPFGKKPLYVYQTKKELAFASDIRAIESLRKNQFTLNRQSLDYYLSECSMPQPATIWQEVSQVNAASVRQIDLDDLSSKEWRYWTLPPETNIENENEALQLVESTLLKAIQKRTIADVPLGCFLSGGVDSGLVVSLLAAHSSERVRTFTVGIEGHPMDESALARLVVQRYNTDHTEIKAKPDFEDIARKMCEYCGEPFADSSIIPSYLVTKEISKHLKVALSGDGGDELFGGYKDYIWAYKADRFLREERRSKLWRARVLVDKVASRFSGRENLGSYEHYTRFTGAEKMFRQMGFNRQTKDRLWKAESRPAGNPGEDWLEEKWGEHPSPWLSDQLMRASLSTRLINDYLVKVDRASMYHSLEVRSPFLDKSLAELAFRIAPDLKFHNKTSKYLLKRLAQSYFDEKIFERKKQGFSIPLAEWLGSKLQGFVNDILCNKDAWIFSLFEFDEVQKIWKAHREGRRNTDGLWALICLELWAHRP